ncbi:MAG TPA: pirin family protein [Polyangia bacterium]|nr:pirin family protein [Polyangia bacterium]
MADDLIRSVTPLGFQWPASDPFLFCVHHDDRYPAGNDALGPAVPLAGRALGQDFEGKDGWRMYHGRTVPGFPGHPHRGFETVTIMRDGFIDHSDSLGATARFGRGDVQWLTAGRGIVHSEMFPLLARDQGNRLELFQIWLNLPRADKMVAPHFTMLWREKIPTEIARDEAGRATEINVVAGRLGGVQPAPPPPSSWAAHADSDVAIWTIKMAPGARWTLPAAAAGTNRVLYFFRGRELAVAGRAIGSYHAVALRPDAAVALENGPDEGELLVLQGRPIGEPVAAYGPFVMTTRAEIQQAIGDFQRTGFGGWPFPSEDPVHPREQTRFARHADGRIEHP